MSTCLGFNLFRLSDTALENNLSEGTDEPDTFLPKLVA